MLKVILNSVLLCVYTCAKCNYNSLLKNVCRILKRWKYFTTNNFHMKISNGKFFRNYGMFNAVTNLPGPVVIILLVTE